jgi:hypothetical protein
MEELLKDENALKNMYDSLDASIKELYTEEEYKKYLENMVKAPQEAMAGATKKVQELGLDVDLSKLTGASAQGFANLMEQMQFSGNSALAENFSKVLNEQVLAGLSAEDVSTVMSTINSIDPSDLESWENLEEKLDAAGVSLPTERLEALKKAGIEAG